VRNEDGDPRRELKAGHAAFCQRRDVGHDRGTLGTCNGQHTQVALLYKTESSYWVDEQGVDVSPHQVCESLGRPAVRYVCHGKLTALLEKFTGATPGLTATAESQGLRTRLRQRRTRQENFGITAEELGRSGVEAQLLFTEDFVEVCHKSHPLANKRRIRLEDLASRTLIRFTRSGSMAQYLDASLRSASLVDSGLEVNQLPTVAGLVASNLGLAVVPELTIPYFGRQHVMIVPLAAPELRREIYLVQASGKQLSKAAKEFIALFNSCSLRSQVSALHK
jgi:DNA-binding transcriptional LysR family regulator